MSQESTPRPPLERLLHRFDLEQLDRDLFTGWPGGGEGRLFGGMVAAQSFMAAARTVNEAEVHSLHAYFLRPGRHGVPITFVVDRIRDGRTYVTRRVVAHQRGEAIFSLEASFARPESPGIDHQAPMPAVPPPDGLPDYESVNSGHTPLAFRAAESPIEIRACQPNDVAAARPAGPTREVWVRPRGVLPEDPVLHAALLVFASDRGMFSAIAGYHGLGRDDWLGASLDHALWFHEPPRWNGWLLYATTSHIARAGRTLFTGNLFRDDGVLIGSVAQEGVFRMARRKG